MSNIFTNVFLLFRYFLAFLGNMFWCFCMATVRDVSQTVWVCTLLCAEFLLMKVTVGVNPLCLFSHIGYLCSCLPSHSVYSKQAAVAAPVI